MLRRAAVAVLAIVAVAVAAASSQATAPGKDGKIVFRRYLGPQRHPGVISDSQVGVIYTINPDGTGERRVSSSPGGATDDMPDWSPDGSRIVFRRERGPDGAIYSVRPDGSGLTRVSPVCPAIKPRRCEEDFTPTFSPDGRTIVFARFDGKHWSIVSVDRGDGAERLLFSAGPRADLNDSPALSPDGTQMALAVHNLGAAKPRDGRAIFVVNVDGSGLSQVTPWKLAGGLPDWSRNGKWILFASNVDLDNKQSQIYVIHPDGTGLSQLTRFKPGTIVRSASFSPDGKWIVLGASGVGGNADLYVMRSDGSGMHPITRTKLWESAPDWGSAR